MAILVALEHRTTYRFDRLVGLGPHVVRLRPAPHCRTPISAYSLRVRPEPHFLNWQQDVFGNHLARLVFPERTTELDIVVDLVADMTVINPFDFFVDEYAERFPFTYEPGLVSDLEPYRKPVVESDGRLSPQLVSWLKSFGAVPPGGQAIVDFLVSVNQKIASDIGYTVRMEQGVLSPEQTLQRGIGSCRDSAWLLVAALRELGLAARFVSGYLVQLRPDRAPGAEQDGPEQDFTDLHAWAEVYIPGAGWIGLDATSGLFAGEGHIPLSATPAPAHSAPVTGLVDPAQTTLEFSNVVRRLREDPRVTSPYSEDDWHRITTLGKDVDLALAEGDVRLTMGGEPTFVSATDMEAPEWHTDADGEDKRDKASALAGRLREHYAPQGLVHHGQGKWYPGEPLPRWQIAMTWRLDGIPVWKDSGLLADPWGPGVVESGSAEAAEAVEVLAQTIAREIGVDPATVLPGYEDPLYALLEEARKPEGPPPAVDPDPTDPSLDNAAARAALVAAWDAGVSSPVGQVVPLFRSEDDTRWLTAHWRTRRGRLFLVPGTSPLGLRLPLDTLGWEPPASPPPRSTFEERDALPESRMAPPVISWDTVVPLGAFPRTALCVEERDGHLFVFLPPTEALERGLDIVAAVERAAAVIGKPVVIEGYTLPWDPRTRTLTVTPDPGVIEVNVQPASSWTELEEISETLAINSRAVGLGTEKFALDGKHTGTGGGSHITLGGVKPADSPLLRRPDLLVSMLTFWQHHPSLSFLFSGAFIGPTSQAPRVDEARHDSLYELEIAFSELARLGDDARPWHVDRLLRHLLTDLTGNTHRAEFCIDKLFSPDSERGRLGLLELRGFEMPPHPRMALVQALLVRSLLARFWAHPYSGPLVRWGTELHDRFLLPATVASDIAEVTADLRAHGFAFEDKWLDPFLEFRFPRLGAVDIGEVSLELRSAIEPWHVLGEEATAGGTARYVDSSVERLQVRVSGLTAGRHVVTCNGVPIRLHPTGTPGIGIAGVRYKAWQPWSGLHPTIAIHAPLVFDIVDTWNNHSLGGCTYHVSHPGGRSYDRFPVNASEAEARRTSRFVASGHTPGALPAAAVELPPVGADEFLLTLDLRRHGVPGSREIIGR